MSRLIFSEQASQPSTPSAAKAAIYVDNTANPQLMLLDDNGSPVALLDTRNTATVAGKTFTSPVINGATSSGSTSLDFSGNSGTFKTSSGANQLSGAVTITDATTPSLTTATGKTNTGNITINGKTSGGIILTSADAMVSNLTVNTTALANGAQTLSLPAIRQAETIAVKPQIAGALVASPTGIANTSGLMLGLANLSASNIITPQVTGRVCITICGVVAQSTTLDGAFWHIRTGTGTAPLNGGALTGTQSGGQGSMIYLTGVLKVPFSITTYMTGATLGTALWIDLVLAAVTGGTATMTQVMVTAFEF